MKNQDPEWRIALVAALVFGLDQLTKVLVIRFMAFESSVQVIPGFFRLVHLGNTGAAWSIFPDSNRLLAVVGLVALVVLILKRRRFGIQTLTGQLAMGMILGGILGNVTDRLRLGHVTDFLNFYLIRSDAMPAEFPSFNIADSGICVGVTLLFILSLKEPVDEKGEVVRES